MARFKTNFNDTLPAADDGFTNLHFQADDPATIPDGGVRNVSFAAPDADAGVKGLIAFPDPLDGDLVLKGDKSWGAAGGAPAAGKATVTIWVPGKYTDAQVIAVLWFDKAVKFTAGLAGAVARLWAVSTGAATFTLKKGAATIGTIAFTAGSNAPTITFAADVTFAAGDYLQVVAPAVADASAAGFGFTYTGEQV